MRAAKHSVLIGISREEARSRNGGNARWNGMKQC